MKSRFRLVRRNNRKRKFYCVDTLTGRRISLQTEDQEAAEQIIQAKNEAERQPQINLQIAQAYLSATDSGAKTRTWDNAFDAIINTKQGETRERWIRAKKQEPFELIRNKLIVATQAEHFLEVLKTGTVSTNVHLRKIHNFCLDMKWRRQQSFSGNSGPRSDSEKSGPLLPRSTRVLSAGKQTLSEKRFTNCVGIWEERKETLPA
jgi:hypothetical protein